MKTSLSRTAVATLALLTLVGCGSSSGGSSSGDSSSPSPSATSSSSASSSASASPSGSSSAGTSAGATISIKNFKFSGPGRVQPGAMITVRNADTEAHTVTADGAGGFDVKIDPGKTATFRAPTKAGAYKFHCTYHSNMHGSLTVG